MNIAMIADYLAISTDTLVHLGICGATVVVCIFLLILLKKRPAKDEKFLARVECQRAVEELENLSAKLSEAEFGARERFNSKKLLHMLNYAKRLLLEAAFESENSASNQIPNYVDVAREIVLSIKRSDTKDVLTEKFQSARRNLVAAIALIDDIIAAEKQLKAA